MVCLLPAYSLARGAAVWSGASARARAARSAARSLAETCAVWDLQPPGSGTRRCARRARRAAGAQDRACHAQGTAYALHDGRAVRVSALGLAPERALGRPWHLGSTGEGARVA